MAQVNLNIDELKGFDAFICTLGTKLDFGEEIFNKIDYEYPLKFA